MFSNPNILSKNSNWLNVWVQKWIDLVNNKNTYEWQKNEKQPKTNENINMEQQSGNK